MINTRNEQPGDAEGIRAINKLVFNDREWDLVDLLRERGRNIVSRVAVDGEGVIGHILFTQVSVKPAAPFRGVGLAPLAVHPGHQNQGIGARLAREGLAACAALGYDYAVVLGHPGYYPRFGFRAASRFGLANIYGADEAFMALEFHPGVLGAFSGIIQYCTEFNELGV